jgi:hypothetical protein
MRQGGCKIPDCPGRPGRGSRFCGYCGGVVDQMEAMTREESRDSGAMYGGRSKNPYERLADHNREKGLTRVRVLLASRNPRRLRAFESALLDRVSYLSKMLNRTTESRGRMRTDVTNYIYVASRPKRGKR